MSEVSGSRRTSLAAAASVTVFFLLQENLPKENTSDFSFSLLCEKTNFADDFVSKTCLIIPAFPLLEEIFLSKIASSWDKKKT